MNNKSNQLFVKEVDVFFERVRNKAGVYPLKNMEMIVEEIQKTCSSTSVLYGILDKKSKLLNYRLVFQHGRFIQINADQHAPFCKHVLNSESDQMIMLHEEELKQLISEELLFENKLLKFFAGYRFSLNHEKDQLLCVFDYKRQKKSETVPLLLEGAAHLLRREEMQLEHDIKLQEEKEKYMAIFNHANDGIFLINNANMIIDVNQKALNIFKCERDAFIGKTPIDFSPLYQPDGKLSDKKAREYISEALSGKPQRFIWQHKKSDDSLFEAEISLGVSEFFTGKLIHALLRDVTEQRKSEKSLVDARFRAEEADRLKSAFLANMSHEIRTPLNSIIGFSDIMLDEETTDEEKSQFLNLISSAGKTLLQLIDDIIDISKLEAGQMRISKSSFDLQVVLDELLLTAQIEQSKRDKRQIELRQKKGVEAKTFFIETDPHRFRQVFMNLLTNALKFVDKGFIEFGYTKPKGGLIQFYVKDTGVGIERDKAHLIFQRFGQIDSTYKRNLDGTGLGLAICHSLVDLLGGKIWFDSEAGKGTTFYFTLPISNDLSMVNLDEDYNYGRIKGDLSSKVFLIADDVKANYLFLKSVLKDTKTKILWAKNGSEAIEMVQNNPAISLVLMDIMMPQTDGYEAARKLKKIAPHIPIVAQTAFAETENQQAAFDAGCDDYITKPISVVELLSLINKLI
ncbi:MAG: response regulator [Bacteroidetes bacterium]|nr:response regulator [Bacteroidota bacterium]MBU1581102.1 response regulator [Bacteroidota bacterium]MBU2558058.1 response regulator [Bacteroidota bacterium]